MARFPPQSSNAATPTTVLMTRPLYGQLLGQQFFAPRAFERARWLQGAKEGTPERRQRNIGMKLVRVVIIANF